MAVNKIIYNKKTLIDLTNDTVTADKLFKGVLAHDKSGNQIVGTFEQSLPTGTKTITANGTYDVTDYATAKVNVPVPNGYVKPSGTKSITSNGTSDVRSYASVNVNVTPKLQSKTVTSNGTVTPDSGYDGFSKVTVNVASSGEDMLQARVDATNSCKYLFYQYRGYNVDFIKDLDTSNVTDMSSMFYTCLNLTEIPSLDTSNVTDMSSMFYNCSKLTEIPSLDTSNVTNMSGMFNSCSVLKTIPQLDTSNVTSMKQMFSNCKALTEIPQLDMIKVSNTSSMFYNCSKLTNLTLLNIKVNLDLSPSGKLTLESLINTVKECINVGSAKTLTMGTANLSKIASTYVKFTDTSQTTIPTNEKGDVVVCESTDEGAMLLKDYALLKNWTLA